MLEQGISAQWTRKAVEDRARTEQGATSIGKHNNYCQVTHGLTRLMSEVEKIKNGYALTMAWELDRVICSERGSDTDTDNT